MVETVKAVVAVEAVEAFEAVVGSGKKKENAAKSAEITVKFEGN